MMKLKSFKDVLDRIQPKEKTAMVKYFDINYNISKFLVDFRVNNKMTQKQMAKKLNVSQVMISKYENGEYNFTLKKLCEISEILNANLIFDMILEADNNMADDDWNIGEKKLEGDLQCLSALKTA